MTSLATDFTSLAGIDLPIVQAPIGSATTPELAAAVSNAGGLGMLSLTWRSPNEARDLIQQTSALTDKPFGINLVLAWDATERLTIALEEGVPIISLSWGDPSPLGRPDPCGRGHSDPDGGHDRRCGYRQERRSRRDRGTRT